MFSLMTGESMWTSVKVWRSSGVIGGMDQEERKLHLEFQRLLRLLLQGVVSIQWCLITEVTSLADPRSEKIRPEDQTKRDVEAVRLTEAATDANMIAIGPEARSTKEVENKKSVEDAQDQGVHLQSHEGPETADQIALEGIESQL
jgi:hypothetical protein